MRRLLAIAVLALVAVLAVPACGGDDDEADQSAGDTTTEAETTTEATTTEVTTTTTAEPSGPVKIRITYRDGKVSGDTGTVPIEKGADVQLMVRADVEDEVHLHGYDLAAEVSPGRPARINFEASDAGRFIAELEHLHLHIVTLRVR
jgi:hypothetical protein